MEDSNEYMQTIEELDDIFDGDIKEYKKYLREQIESAEQLNYIYGSNNYKPFKTDLFRRQLDYLEKLTGEVKVHMDKDCVEDVVYDVVNNPYHYASGKYECIEVMRDTFGDEMLKSFCILNAFKYIYRHHKKNGLEDLKKARFYLDYAIEKIG